LGLALGFGRGDLGARIVPEADPRDGLAHAVFQGSARSYWRD
jgi:hypothetical protein